VIDAAVHGSVAIDVIDAKGLAAISNGRSRQTLQEIADGTGGHFFRDSNDIVGSMELAAHPEVSYSLAFTPASRDGKFHSLKIRFKSKRGDALEYRPGYISRKDDDSKSAPAARPMDDAVFSSQTLPDILAVVAMKTAPARENLIRASIFITVDVNPLLFASSHDRHMQQIVFLTVLLDGDGGFVTGVESTMDLALTDATFSSLQKDGLRTVATLDAAPGTYQLRTIIREGMKGSLGAATAKVELRQQ
jgi:hypothetical protein